MAIRRAKKLDYLEIRNVFAEVHDYHLKNTNNVFKDIEPFSYDEFLELINDENIIILVSENVIIDGFLIAEVIEKEGRLTKKRKTLYINQLGVLKKDQHGGIGTNLVKEVEKIARNLKCDNVMLTVWAFNKKAMKFYKELNFNERTRTLELKL